LDERLALDAILTTEDTIRYTPYVARKTSGGIQHTDLTLECPHPTLAGATAAATPEEGGVATRVVIPGR
jgi:hypothetical protein